MPAPLARRVLAAGRDALRLVFPQRCAVCGRRLLAGEAFLCTACFLDLPFTRLHGAPGNVVERLFWGKLPIVRANAYLRYLAGADSRMLLWQLKYYGRPQAGIYWGRAMATDLLDAAFFDGVDLIVPLPLAQARMRKRGYNQSQQLARGVAQVTGLPVCEECVVRVVDNPSQTHLRAAERQANVEGIFRLDDSAAVAGRHVLLVDDVITTGASLVSCGRTLAAAPGVRISILALALGGTHPHVPLAPQPAPRFADDAPAARPADAGLPFLP